MFHVPRLSSLLSLLLFIPCLLSHLVLAQQPQIIRIAMDVLDSASSASLDAASIQSISSASSHPSPFLLSTHSSPHAALQAYAQWHSAVLASPTLCRSTPVLVWRAQAGWGDSINALTSAFRYALAASTPRLFFIQWGSKNAPQLWRIGLEEPGFRWDFVEASTNHANCDLTLEALAGPQRSSDGAPSRVLSLVGSIVSSHPLAGSLDALYKDYTHVIYRLTDGELQNFLLRPNDVLREKWIQPVSAQLRPAGFNGLVIGVQIRTGEADGKTVAERPVNANFLVPGDETLFVAAVGSIITSSAAREMSVFLSSDSPSSAGRVASDLQAHHPGLRIVQSSKGAVTHCGPTKLTDSDGVLRMMSDWFLLKRSDRLVLTAWSLFGSSAAEGHPERDVMRIDSSLCGQAGTKPCQMR
jgi:hypothetical protein